MKREHSRTVSPVNAVRRPVVAGLAGTLAWAATAPRAAAAATPRGIDTGKLEGAVSRARGLGQLNSLIIAMGGEVRFAEAFRGPGLDRAVNIKSVAKTLVATLAGIALDRDILQGVDQPVLPLLEGHAPANIDPRLGRLTIDHLLTMRAGLRRPVGTYHPGSRTDGSDHLRSNPCRAIRRLFRRAQVPTRR